MPRRVTFGHGRYGVPFRKDSDDPRLEKIRSATESLCFDTGIEGVEVALKFLAIGLGDAMNHLFDIGEDVQANDLKRTLDLLADVIEEFEV